MKDNWQILIIVYGVLAFAGSVIGYVKCRLKNDNLGVALIPWVIYGAFVWADIVIFGFFWFIVSLICLYLQNWILFLLFQSLFWLIRSLGETNYWFNQQFTTVNRNPSKLFPFSKFFNNDDYTIWFVFQIFWQCVAVVSGILTIYFVKLWLF